MRMKWKKTVLNHFFQDAFEIDRSETLELPMHCISVSDNDFPESGPLTTQYCTIIYTYRVSQNVIFMYF